MRKEFQDYWDELRLGDRLELVFKYTGIKWLVKKIHPNCKCDERKDKLNNFRIKRK